MPCFCSCPATISLKINIRKDSWWLGRRTKFQTQNIFLKMRTKLKTTLITIFISESTFFSGCKKWHKNIMDITIFVTKSKIWVGTLVILKILNPLRFKVTWPCKPPWLPIFKITTMPNLRWKLTISKYHQFYMLWNFGGKLLQNMS